MSKIKDVLTGKKPLIDVWHYFVGNFRYKLYYSKSFKWLMRTHIIEQIEFRIEHMNIDCYNSGQCVKCGCETTKLQMANKSCNLPCYPTMMNKKSWKEFQKGGKYYDKHGIWLKLFYNGGKPLLFSHRNSNIDRHVPTN